MKIHIRQSTVTKKKTDFRQPAKIGIPEQAGRFPELQGIVFPIPAA